MSTQPDIKSVLKQAFQLGQTYWQQADSDYPSQWAKSDATRNKFHQLVDETLLAIKPPARQWVGLSDLDKANYINQDLGASRLDAMDYAERLLKERNHVA